MKTIRILSLILLAVTMLAAVYLTLGYLYSLMPEHDGIPRITWLLYGDSGWSHEQYYTGARTAVWIFTAAAVENIVLAILGICRNGEKG